MRLRDLFQKSSGRPELQGEVDTEFWKAVEESGAGRWRLGDPVPRTGRRILVGLASYSRYDVELAQAIIDRAAAGFGDIAVELFNVLDLRDMSGFDQYVPGIRPVSQTPVVGLWEGGVLRRAAQGFPARQLAREVIQLGA